MLTTKPPPPTGSLSWNIGCFLAFWLKEARKKILNKIGRLEWKTRLNWQSWTDSELIIDLFILDLNFLHCMEIKSTRGCLGKRSSSWQGAKRWVLIYIIRWILRQKPLTTTSIFKLRKKQSWTLKMIKYFSSFRQNCIWLNQMWSIWNRCWVVVSFGIKRGPLWALSHSWLFPPI